MTSKVESILIEWCRWKKESAWNYWPPVSSLGKMMEEGAGAGQGGGQGVPDGGLGAMVDRMAGAIAWDNRCRDTQKAISEMPSLYSAFVRAAYDGHWRDLPRPRSYVIKAMGCTEAEYRDIKARAFGWLEGRMNIAPEPNLTSCIQPDIVKARSGTCA